jgi:hypothetical protein
MFLEGIYARLAADSGITSLNAKVYPGLAPKESVLPYVVYTQVGGGNVSSLDGANRLQPIRVRFSCYGASYSVAKKLAAAVKNSLSGLLVTLSSGDSVQGSWLEFEGDDSEPDEQGTIYSSHVDFSFMYRDNS